MPSALASKAVRQRSVRTLERDDPHLRQFASKLLTADVLLIEDLEKLGSAGAIKKFGTSTKTLERVRKVLEKYHIRFA